MKKLSLKKTTLSRLNNEGLSKVKGGDVVLPTGTRYCPTVEQTKVTCLFEHCEGLTMICETSECTVHC